MGPIERILRVALALPAGDPAPGGHLDTLGLGAPSSVVYVDAGALLAWTLAGLRVFSLPGGPEHPEGSAASEDTEGPEARLAAALAAVIGLAAVDGLGARSGLESAEPGEPQGPWLPAMGLALGEAERVVLALAMLRNGGNITHVARMLGTSRRTAREHLKAAGLYPWPPVVAKPSDDGELPDDDGEHHEGGTHVI